MNSIKIVCTLIAVFLLTACTPSLKVPVVVPPRVDLKMERVSVYPVKDFRNRQENAVATSELESVFVNAEVKGQNVFQVIAMDKLGSLQEQSRIESQVLRGFFDQSTVGSLRAKGVQGLVFSLLEETVSNQTSQSEIKGKIVRCMTRTVNSTFHPKIVKAQDAAIVAQNSYSGAASKTSCDGSSLDAGINGELGREARSEALAKMRKDIAPYTSILRATILTNFCGESGGGKLDKLVGKTLKGSVCDDSQPPARVVELVKNGEVNVKGERLDKACAQWSEAASIHSRGFIIPYLQGVCAEVARNDLNTARSYYKKADDQASVPVAAIRDAMKRLDMKVEEKFIVKNSTPQAPKRVPDGNVIAVQKALSDAGYDPGPADGFMGDKTRKALKFFQEDYGISVTGAIDSATKDALNL